jgi:membrane-associated phospholipid phosphatase
MVILVLLAQALCPAEEKIMQRIGTEWYSNPVYRCAHAIGYAGHPAVSVALPVVLLHVGEEPCAWDSYMGMFINCATILPLKYVVNRRRPSGDHVRWDASFPSGHTTCAFTQAYILSYHYPKASIPVFALAGAIGLSRIYIQKHYPSDIIASVALGVLTGYLVTSFVD